MVLIERYGSYYVEGATGKLSNIEVLDLLKQIAIGEVVVTTDGHEWLPPEFEGNCDYTCSDGSKLVVFWEGGILEYVDTVLSPDERAYTFTDYDHSDCAEVMLWAENKQLHDKLEAALLSAEA